MPRNDLASYSVFRYTSQRAALKVDSRPELELARAMYRTSILDRCALEPPWCLSVLVDPQISQVLNEWLCGMFDCKERNTAFGMQLVEAHKGFDQYHNIS